MIRKSILSLMILGLFVGSQAQAQMKIGYIDSQKILTQYQAAVEAQEKLEAESAQWGQELQKKNEQFRDLQQQLDQQSLLLSEAKKQEKAQELQNLALEIQQFQNEKWGETGEFFRRREELLKPVFDDINTVIHQMGEDDGYDFIFDSVAGNLLHAKEKYDLTDEVLAELEKAITKNN